MPPTDVLRALLNRVVFVYLDDFLIFSRSHGEHVNHVHNVLHRLLENRLYRRRNVTFMWKKVIS